MVRSAGQTTATDVASVEADTRDLVAKVTDAGQGWT